MMIVEERTTTTETRGTQYDAWDSLLAEIGGAITLLRQDEGTEQRELATVTTVAESTPARSLNPRLTVTQMVTPLVAWATWTRGRVTDLLKFVFAA